ncbi:hypothetical protein AG0111_0g4723 [Alternaria gaisen]|uniref:Uncharacterized protein n=1 Tax=Alternaria gaisen TaxID=167740 RepID=A0ACB6FRJ2_9PLEO|nr:hypothetical protein AG0111_0g4723 [Alternaria gaisen]
MADIKKELFSDVDDSGIQPEGLMPPRTVPQGFELEEWQKLTGDWESEEQEIRYILSLRGQADSPKKGRPTNFKQPFKGNLSTTHRAIAQRNRAATQDDETKALTAARNADRAAKHALKNRLNKRQAYKDLSERNQKKVIEDEYENMSQKRFDNHSSAEWLEGQLQSAHQKWEKAYHEADLRAHQIKVDAAQEIDNPEEEKLPRIAQRLHSRYGLLDVILRRTYLKGLEKLEKNSFDSKEEKQAFQAWVSELKPEELAIYMDKDWEQLELPPMKLESDSLIQDDGKPYIPAADSDDCEEEIDDDSDIEDYFASLPDEYETHNEWVDKAKEVDGYETEFEGFSD